MHAGTVPITILRMPFSLVLSNSFKTLTILLPTMHNSDFRKQMFCLHLFSAQDNKSIYHERLRKFYPSSLEESFGTLNYPIY